MSGRDDFGVERDVAVGATLILALSPTGPVVATPALTVTFASILAMARALTTPLGIGGNVNNLP